MIEVVPAISNNIVLETIIKIMKYYDMFLNYIFLYNVFVI